MISFLSASFEFSIPIDPLMRRILVRNVRHIKISKIINPRAQSNAIAFLIFHIYDRNFVKNFLLLEETPPKSDLQRFT